MIIVMCAVLYILVGVFYKNKGGSELALGQHKSFINRFSTYMGGLTYPLYLIHGVNGIILMNLLHGVGVSGSLALSVTILFVFLASAFVYSVVENNFSVLLGRHLRGYKQ